MKPWIAVLFLTAQLLAGTPSSAPDETGRPEPRILFIGLWDRAFQQMAKASEETGVPVRMQGTLHGETPAGVTTELQAVDFAKFDLVYVLQIDQTAAHVLADLLGKAKAAHPGLHVVQLDQRSTQQELIDHGILELDPKVREYWRGFGLENLKRLLAYSRVKYLGGTGGVQEPVPAAPAGLYHPQASGMFSSWADYLAWYSKQPQYGRDRPLVAVFIQQDYVVYGNHRVYDALIQVLEGRGINVAPMFGSMKELQTILRECSPSLLMLQHHSGPEEMPKDGGKPFLEEMNVPYIYSAGMMSGITVKEWQDDVRGTRMGGYGQLARHEMYGIIEPFLIGARGSSAYGFALDEPITERVNRVVDRVEGWLNLRRTPAQDKKIAIIYFHKYLGKAEVGRPAAEMSRYLDPHASLLELLRALSRQGYRVDSVPGSTEELIELMKTSGRNVPSWAPGELDELIAHGKPVLLPQARYMEWYARKLSSTARAAVEKVHGPPPGTFMVSRQPGTASIVLPCVRFGNVLIGPQPDRGTIQDRDLVHSRTAPPPHNYLAFYWWLQEEFGADAIVHFGTHGSDFYLPGKEMFLSGDCFPDAIVGAMPNFYVWSIQNIGEAIIAKRRSYSVIVDHGVPPILAASRDAQIDSLLELLDRYAAAIAPPVKEVIGRELARELQNSPFPAELNLTIPQASLPTDAQTKTISEYLRHVTRNNVIQGMHVLGVPPEPEKALPFVEHIVSRNTDITAKLTAAGVKGDADEAATRLLRDLLMESKSPAEAARAIGVPETVVADDLAAETKMARDTWDGLARSGDEIANLLAGLEGKYVPPGPGGDPILRPDALPTGRNLYGLSPQEIPAQQAWDLARKVTDEFLAKFHQEHGRYPEKLAFTMTGMETFRNMGVTEAQILYLLGIEPEWSPGKLVCGLKVIPREQLGRPRVDTVMSVNGIYLKDFAPCVRVLDEAVRMAAACDEPDNVVRRNALKIESELRSTGVAPERAKDLGTARVIGSEAGGGGARLVWFLPRSGTWQERKEILELWRTMRTHVYTASLWGEKLPELHDKVYAGTEGVITSWSDNLLGPMTNHHYPEETGGLAMSVEWINGKKSDVSVFDLRRRDGAGAVALEEVLSLELRSVAFNLEWIKGQMQHDYAGASQFMQIVDNAFQWEAVRQGAVWPGAWDRMVDIYVRDNLHLGLDEWFERHNPFAFQELTATLLEAARKGYWQADPQTLREVALAHAQSVAKFGHGVGPYAGGNEPMRSLLIKTLNQPGDEQLRKTFLEKVELAEKAARDRVGGEVAAKNSQGAPSEQPAGGEQVSGRAMEKVADAPRPTKGGQASLRQLAVYGGLGLAAVAMVLIGYRFGVGTPGKRWNGENSMTRFEKSTKTNRAGFTLIEVLVVVAIIALLIGILMPSLSLAKEQARQAVCASNLHQLGLSSEMYVSTYGCFVPVVTEKGEYGRWLRLIDNVMSKRNEAKRSAVTRLGVCPTAPERAEALKLRNHRMDRDIAYGYNYNYLGDSRWLYKPGTTGRFPVRPSQLKAPARMVAMADSDGTGGWCPQPNAYSPNGGDPNAIGHHGFMIDPPELPPEAGNGPAFAPEKCTMSAKPGFARVSNRHPRGAGATGASVLHVDGHAQFMDRRALEDKGNAPWNGWRREP